MHNANILLIDSDTLFVDPVIKSLRDVFSSVKHALNLLDAETILKQDNIDIVVYNAGSGHQSGVDALSDIRAHDPNTSIIAYSESPEIDDVIDILKRGVFDYLTIPFETDRLIECILKGIENKDSFLEIIDLSNKLIKNNEIIEKEKKELKDKNKKLKALSSITKAMTKTLDLDEILHEIINGIHNVFLFDRIFVSLVDHDKGVEEAKVAMGLEDSIYDDAVKELCWDIHDNANNPWMDALLNEKRPVIVNAPLEDEDYKDKEIIKYHKTTFVKIPLIAEGSVVGTLTIDNANSDKPISDHEISTLKVFADHAGIAIEKAQLYNNLMTAHEQLKEMQKKIIDAEKLTVISELAVSVNHEINNPLCSISLNVDLLKKKLKDDPGLSKKLQMIAVDIERIKSITGKLASIKSIRSTQYLPEVKMLDIKKSSF